MVTDIFRWLLLVTENVKGANRDRGPLSGASGKSDDFLVRYGSESFGWVPIASDGSNARLGAEGGHKAGAMVFCICAAICTGGLSVHFARLRDTRAELLHML